MNTRKASYRPVEFPSDVRKALNEVNSRLVSFKTSEFVHDDLFDPSVHLFKRRGKMIRPALILLVAHLLKRNPSDYVDLAVAAELIHTSSLIHDDMIDGDAVRRGIPSVHKKYGSEAALLAGDALIAKAISMSSRYGKRVLDSIARSSLDMCAGELLDYNFQKKMAVPNIKQYTDIARLKSASLIASCSNAVALHIGDSNADDLYRFGNNIGIAFQIRDDVADYLEWMKSHRKGVLTPNIVSSIESESNVGTYSAVLKA
ncbi:MAG: polyprenyl synthetase family protein, partial [Candidatus Micrarchaeota archaeon]|nr:polyprenyl synthetase family protein [Candidatus Micrarchaeota archaeon]